MRHFAALTVLLTALASPAWAMSVADVLDLLRAEVSEALILDQMDAETARFSLDTEDILALKNAGASDDLIRALIATADEPAGENNWTDDYYSPDYYRSRNQSLSASFTYDPFGYYWYCSPYYYGYYYPFRTVNFGAYYGGCLTRSWWSWYAYWPSYYRDYCAVRYPLVYWQHDGRRSVTRHTYADRSTDRYREGRTYSRDNSRERDARRSVQRTPTQRSDRSASTRSLDRNPDRRSGWTDRGGSGRVHAPRDGGTTRSTPSTREVREPRRTTSRQASPNSPAPRGGNTTGRESPRRWSR